MQLDITYAQPLDADGRPAGPVLWICEAPALAGALLLDEPATDQLVAQNLPHTTRRRFDETDTKLHTCGALICHFTYNTETKEIC